MAGCFEQINQNFRTASEHTQHKRQKGIWCGLDPYDAGSKYAFGIKVSGEVIVLTAPSQGELLELIKAKYAANPSLVGADSCIYNVRAGSLITYDGTTKKVEFNSSDQFWRCANADPMRGFVYPSSVSTSYQSPNQSKNIPTTTDGTDVLVAALYGKDKLR